MNVPRRLGWALHAFPRRFRVERSAEIEATFHEAELAGEHRPYGAVALLDVVISGWVERARTHPPLGTYLKYRLLNGRLEPRWHAWMFDDLDGWFTIRRSVWIVSPLALLLTTAWFATDGQMPLPPAWIWIVWAIAMGLGGRLDRRRTLKRHGYDPRTRLWVPPVVVHWVWAPHRIRRAAPTLAGVAVALLIVMPFAMITLLFPDRSVRSFAVGSSSSQRIVDHTVAFGIGALVVGVIALVVGLAYRRRFAARLLVPADADDRMGFVIVPAGRTEWVVPLGVAFVGVATSVLPIAPLVVPVFYLVAGCASPLLLVIANMARQLERSGSGPVGFTTTARQPSARTIPR